MKHFAMVWVCFLFLACGETRQSNDNLEKSMTQKVRLMTLDPGHFHAALVQKTMYPEVDSTSYVYAPEGPEVQDYLAKITQYNSRNDDPTAWEVEKYSGSDYLERMLAEKPGNVMVVAGKNSKKIDYILGAVKSGIHVYADKPLVIDPHGFEKLKEAFEVAGQNNLLLYDIMTERFEVTTVMQRLFSGSSDIFGDLVDGSLEAPAISKESVHHFFKYVSGQPLVRPPLFFDVNEEGEGIVDVTTHLVDLVQWEAFPEQVIDTTQIQMLSAKRWPTELTPEEYQQVTGLESFPDYLQKDISDDVLKVYCNGEMNYTINGKHAKVSVIWNYRAPEGTGDTHYSIMRGTKSDLIIRQGDAEDYRPTLYVRFKEDGEWSPLLQAFLENEISRDYPGTSAEQISDKEWRIAIPEEFKIGHEAHFAQVTENYLAFMEQGRLPAWEVPNMLAKYYTTIEAYKMAKADR